MKAFYKTTTRSILTVGRRRSKMFEEINALNIQVDEITYFNQMKQFLLEVEGSPPNSVKYITLRNKHYEILRQKAIEFKTPIKESLEKRYLRFILVLIPESIECYLLLSLLNYYDFRYKAVFLF